MTKINDAVKLVVQENPLYATMIKSGLVNYANLARKIQPTVESMTDKDVKINTLVKSLTQIKPETTWGKQIDLLRNSKLSLDDKYKEKLVSRPDEIDSNSIVAVRTPHGFKCLMGGMDDGDLALIKIELPEDASKSPGLTLFVVEYLMLQKVNIEKIYRFDTEIILTAKQEDAVKILEHLSNLIYRSKV